MKKILVIEDDNLLNKTLCFNLKSYGYEADSAINLKEALSYICSATYDLIVLDINLPDGDGYSFCKKIVKEKKNIPVIFLTANDMESDILKGYEVGAVDYITKPFSMSVFQRKIQVLFSYFGKEIESSNIFNDDNLYIDFKKLVGTLKGYNISLTANDYKILWVFVKNPKIVLTRQRLFEILWDIEENFVDEHTLTTAISRIRGKIEIDGIQYIKTVYGMGYMWVGENKSEI